MILGKYFHFWQVFLLPRLWMKTTLGGLFNVSQVHGGSWWIDIRSMLLWGAFYNFQYNVRPCAQNVRRQLMLTRAAPPSLSVVALITSTISTKYSQLLILLNVECTWKLQLSHPISGANNGKIIWNCWCSRGRKTFPFSTRLRNIHRIIFITA